MLKLRSAAVVQWLGLTAASHARLTEDDRARSGGRGGSPRPFGCGHGAALAVRSDAVRDERTSTRTRTRSKGIEATNRVEHQSTNCFSGYYLV